MKKNLKKRFGWISLVVILIAASVFTGFMQTWALETPFADMYDSNAVFLEQVEGILQLEEDMAGAESDA